MDTNEDLIANNFADGVNKNIIKRNISLLFVILTLFSIIRLERWIDH